MFKAAQGAANGQTIDKTVCMFYHASNQQLIDATNLKVGSTDKCLIKLLIRMFKGHGQVRYI